MSTPRVIQVKLAEPTRQFVQVARPVIDDWKCQRSGDCCTKPQSVVMRVEEKELIERTLTIAKLVKLTWFESPQEGFVELLARPCPLHEFDEHGKSTCTVHDIRPYQCRRFACLRPDPETEPFVMAPISPYLKFGMIGCANLRDRLVNSRVARRAYELIQRKAQRWGCAHGWKD